MTRNDDISKQLDAALHAAFPSGDVGYPTTPHTERARAATESAIAIAGVPVKTYNFHEVGKYVDFNVSYPEVVDGVEYLTVGAWCIKVKTLDTLSDAALIQQWIPLFQDYKREHAPDVMWHDPDDRP